MNSIKFEVASSPTWKETIYGKSAKVYAFGLERNDSTNLITVDTKFFQLNRNHQRLINPHSNYIRKWDMFMIFFLLFTALVTPFEVAFLSTKLNTLFILNRIVDVFFIKDMVMNLFLITYDESSGSWVTDRGKIMKYYLKGWFLIDMISVLPFDTLGIFFSNTTLGNFKITRVFRLFRLFKLSRIIRGQSIYRRWEAKLKTTCLFRVITDLEIVYDVNGRQYNWLILNDVGGVSLISASAMDQYTVALYWSVMTLTTIGYGDVVPSTYLERVVAIICMLTGAGCYAYVVGGVCKIVSSMDASTGKFHQTMDTLNDYFRDYRIPIPLRERIRDYFHSSRSMHQEKHYQELLLGMSPGLRGEVTIFNHKWMLEISFFNSSPLERREFITELALVLQPAVFSPTEFVVREGEYNTKMHLIQRGLATRNNRVYGSGSFFGEDIILHLHRRNFKVAAISYLHTQTLRKRDLDYILSSGCYPETSKCIRKAVVKVAFQRKFVKYSKYVASRNLDDEGDNDTIGRSPSRRSSGIRLPDETQNNYSRDLHSQQSFFTHEQLYSTRKLVQDDDSFDIFSLKNSLLSKMEAHFTKIEHMILLRFEKMEEKINTLAHAIDVRTPVETSR